MQFHSALQRTKSSDLHRQLSPPTSVSFEIDRNAKKLDRLGHAQRVRKHTVAKLL